MLLQKAFSINLSSKVDTTSYLCESIQLLNLESMAPWWLSVHHSYVNQYSYSTLSLWLHDDWAYIIAMWINIATLAPWWLSVCHNYVNQYSYSTSNLWLHDDWGYIIAPRWLGVYHSYMNQYSYSTSSLAL